MKIYCSGIGGIGLSAYAALQNDHGHTVSGSDRAKSALTDDLQSQGISVFYNQDGTHVPDDADLFVYSEAIPEDAPERKKAEEYGIKQLSYFAALGDLSRDLRVIAVCGTHGKSSTTAMAATVLIDAGLDPTVVVGTKVPQLSQGVPRNWRRGASNLFLVEACEYRGSFLHLHPDIVLMTNVDGDHFDAFDSLDAYQQIFQQFLTLLPDDGVLITHRKDLDCARLADTWGGTIIDADVCAPPTLSIPGEHMRENAALVSALADHMDVAWEESLSAFSGTWRRFEKKGEYRGIPIIDDYAHHPIEIKATIASAKSAFPGKRIVCLFQPHMHQRTRRFYQEFCAAFKEADVVLVTDVYDARPESETSSVDAEVFAKDIGTETLYVGDTSNAKERTKAMLQEGDVLIVMGAGDITTVAEALTS